jgi:hypothetical protein
VAVLVNVWRVREDELLKGMQTNAVCSLEGMSVRHELLACDADPDDLTAQVVTNKIGLPSEQVFKPMVAQRPPRGLLRDGAWRLATRPEGGWRRCAVR